MVTSRSRHAFFCGTTQAPPKKSLKRGKSTNASSQIRDFLPFSKFKIVTFNDGYQADSERSDS